MAEVKDFMLTDDMSLDEIEDMPGFEGLPSGQYKLALNEGIVADELPDGRPIFRMNCTVEEVIGLVDDTLAEADQPKVGAEAGFMFMRTTKLGAANWKAVAKVLSPIVGSTKVSEINEGCKGISIVALLKKTQSKTDKTKYYTNIVDIAAA